jgi:hypothetical protein
MQVKKNGLTLRVEPDDYPPTAREECFDLGHLLCWHRKYELGEEHPYETAKDFYADKELQDKIFVRLPVYMLDHSGLRFSTRPFTAVDPQGWDSGQVGVIYATKENVSRICGKLSEETRGTVEQYLIEEIQTFDDFQTREYYAYYIEGREGDIVDSGGGYYGDGLADVIDAMRVCIDKQYIPLFDKAIAQAQM